MKRLLIAVIIVIIFFGGYVLGSYLPITGFSVLKDQGISGQAKLEVKLLTVNGLPLSDVEIDLGKQPGPPAKGGVALTNEKGIATFNIQPGDYVIFFNSNSFPQNMMIPELVRVAVNDGVLNEKTLIIKNVK